MAAGLEQEDILSAHDLIDPDMDFAVRQNGGR
jgi:hypothetical protein